MVNNQWQPIETAPKDGSFFLGADAEDVCLCQWAEEVEDGVDYMGNDAGFQDMLFQRFYPSRSFGLRQYQGLQPTHWMPLPEPPR